MSLLINALYAKCRYYVVLYMPIVLVIMYRPGRGTHVAGSIATTASHAARPVHCILHTRNQVDLISDMRELAEIIADGAETCARFDYVGRQPHASIATALHQLGDVPDQVASLRQALKYMGIL